MLYTCGVYPLQNRIRDAGIVKTKAMETDEETRILRCPATEPDSSLSGINIVLFAITHHTMN